MRLNVTTRNSGFLLMELAIALLVVGGLMALLVPLWSMQGQMETDRLEVLQMEQAREALLSQAVVAGGLPAPLAFKESAFDSGVASSHSDVTPELFRLDAGWPGALPGHLLGLPTVSALKTAYWYDVQPALRSNAASGFYPLVAELTGVWSFDPIVMQFDPDINPNLSTAGNPSQLCRNLNTLQAIEQNIRAYVSGSVAVYRRDHINLTLPRVWAAGYETQFSWNSALGYSEFNPLSGTRLDSAFDNSFAAAFTVVRRQPAALRRLDRQNAVYQQVGLSGLDPSLVERGYDLNPPTSYIASAAERGFRIYENPLSKATDQPTSDTNDYGGLVRAVSLAEFADSLRQAGLCRAPAEACKANQLFVRFGNYVSSLPPTGTPERLTLRWELVGALSLEDPAIEILRSGDVNGGNTTDGICLDAFSTDRANEALERYLRISFISPAGTVGYAAGTSWYRGGVLVDPTGSSPLPLADDGSTRWRNLEALSAAQGGKTVTITCTGAHTVSADGAAGQLVPGGASLPTCVVTQLP
jgi:type II secretory pathway pseudopilin PulG